MTRQLIALIVIIQRFRMWLAEPALAVPDGYELEANLDAEDAEEHLRTLCDEAEDELLCIDPAYRPVF